MKSSLDPLYFGGKEHRTKVRISIYTIQNGCDIIKHVRKRVTFRIAVSTRFYLVLRS